MHALSRAVILVLVTLCLATYLTSPVGVVEQTLDVVARAYLMFLCCVMAHEGSHGHLGSSRSANDWWGRIALLAPMVPYVTFRKTHRMHHARTNVPEDDPDYFIKPRHWIEVPFRAVAIPHYWIVWLRTRGWLLRRDIIELLCTYLGLSVLYGSLAALVGVERVVTGAIPSLVLVSILLWYPFAVRTHEGFSLGAPDQRSHNYFGFAAYWFSLGLSMHRSHHLHPRLSWIELLAHVERKPGALPFTRDVRLADEHAE